MNTNPSYQDFVSGYNQHRTQIVWQEISADLETPVSAFLKLTANDKYSFLLESVERAKNRSRYSIIGYQPDLIFQSDDLQTCRITDHGAVRQLDDKIGVKQHLEQIIQEIQIDFPAHLPAHLPKAVSGIFGYLSYNAVRLLENIPDNNPAQINLPAIYYFRPKFVAVFDNIRDSLIIVELVHFDPRLSPAQAWYQAQNHLSLECAKLQNPISQYYNINPDNAAQKPALEPRALMGAGEYQKLVLRAKQYIQAGDVFQVVLSQRYQIDNFEPDAFAYYRALRHTNPSPYMFYFNFGEFFLVGASPETLVKCENNRVTIRPLAGTRKRGETPAQDAQLERELLNDEKEKCEHLMLLDLGRNDVGRVAKIGSVSVVEQFMVERYSHVMHIVSQVEGELAQDQTPLSALMAGLPAGTVSGAPKIRAMQIIDELESLKREVYAGAVGYFSAAKDMDHCIALRTAVLKNRTLYLQAGAGVVYDSDPDSENAECANKARAMVKAAQDAVYYYQQHYHNQK